jgi:uncharacterized protein YggT (Ycf19 family)
MATSTPRSENRPGIARQISEGLTPVLAVTRAILRALYARIALLTRLAFAVVLALVGVRILFKVTGANEAASFVRFVYRISGVVVEPFQSIFADRTVNQHPFEISSIVAIGVWAAAAFIFVRVVRILVAAGK